MSMWCKIAVSVLAFAMSCSGIQEFALDGVFPRAHAEARGDLPNLTSVLAKRAVVCKNAKTPKCDFDYVMPGIFAGSMDVSADLAATFERFGQAAQAEEIRAQLKRNGVYLEEWLKRLADCWAKNKDIGCGMQRLQPDR